MAGRFPLLGAELLASSTAPGAAAEAADRLGVAELTQRPLHTLSGGQLQRMYLARAIGCVAAGAQVLLADEPTAALDFDGQEEAADVLTSLPVTLVVVTHDRTLAERCDRVLEMAAGLLAGGPVNLATADLGTLLQLVPVQRAGIALLLAAIGLPVIGVVIVGLDIMPVRFAMMHVALLGIALGLLTGLDPMLCALVACALAGAGVAPLARTPDGLSGAMGLLMSLAIAAALLLLAVTGVNASGAFALLWGSILSVGTPDLIVLGVLALAVPGLFWWRRREIGLLLYDRELAQCSGVPVRALTAALLVLVAIAVAGAIKLTGALLVDALTLLPALAARRLGSSLKSITLWAIGIGVVVNLTGFVLALWLDWPPGPVLVLTAGAVVLAVHFIPERRISSWRTPASVSLPSSH